MSDIIPAPEKTEGTPLTESFELDAHFLDGYSTLPDGRRVRAGGGYTLVYDHGKRAVVRRKWFSNGETSETTEEKLRVPASVATKEALRAYVKKRRPEW